MPTNLPPATPADEAATETFVGRLFDASVTAFDILSVYLGDRLGLYRALATGALTTHAELAARAGIDERYAREWLEQQAATGILEVDDAAADPDRPPLPAAAWACRSAGGSGEPVLDGAACPIARRVRVW